VYWGNFGDLAGMKLFFSPIWSNGEKSNWTVSYNFFLSLSNSVKREIESKMVDNLNLSKVDWSIVNFLIAVHVKHNLIIFLYVTFFT
jgi:hypothetical protein